MAYPGLARFIANVVARFIANSSSCTTTELCKLLTSSLTAIKSHAIRYCETVYETSNKNWFWSIKHSDEVLSKLKCRGELVHIRFFSTLYTTMQHNLIKEKILELIERTFKRAFKIYGSLFWPVMTERFFFTSSDQSRYTLWSCQNVCDALSYLLYNIYIRFVTKLYRQIVGIPIGTNFAPLVAVLFITATKESLWILLTMAGTLMLSRRFIRLPGTSMTF